MLSNLITQWNTFPVFDIGQRIGGTSYIDFIKDDEPQHPIMRGIDYYQRPFILIKAEIIDNNQKKWPVFETFFQRYTDDTQLWMGCGHYGDQFLDTSGGLRQDQANFLKELVTYKQVEITPDMIDSLRISYSLTCKMNESTPIKIQLTEAILE